MDTKEDLRAEYGMPKREDFKILADYLAAKDRWVRDNYDKYFIIRSTPA